MVEVSPGWHALGYSTTSGERASGQHAKDLLVIIEEASGVEDEIWNALDSLKYSKLVAIGNPIRAEGRFVDLIRQADKDREDCIPPNKAVCAIRIPSTESPHAYLEKSPYGLADRTWLEACYRHYGSNSLWVGSHIDARIPELSADVLMSKVPFRVCGQGVGRSGRIARFSQGKWWFESSHDNRLLVRQLKQNIAMTGPIRTVETDEIVASQDRSGMIEQAGYGWRRDPVPERFQGKLCSFDAALARDVLPIGRLVLGKSLLITSPGDEPSTVNLPRTERRTPRRTGNHESAKLRCSLLPFLNRRGFSTLISGGRGLGGM